MQTTPLGVFEANAFVNRTLLLDDGSIFGATVLTKRPGTLLTATNCLSVGDVSGKDSRRPILVVPEGSSIADDGSTVTITGLGKFSFGAELPPSHIQRKEFTKESLPKSLQGCDSLQFIYVAP